MSRREWRLFVADMLEASGKISGYVSGMSFEDFCADTRTGVALEKLTPLLQLRYQNSIADAVADLGRPEDIGQLFSGFQRYLYEASA